MLSEYLMIGEITKPQGVRGEMLLVGKRLDEVAVFDED